MLGLCRTNVRFVFTLLVASLFVSAHFSYAHDSSDELKARLSPFEQHGTGTKQKIHLEPVYLDGGSELSVTAPSGWLEHAQQIIHSLERSHEHLQALFGEIPRFRTSIQLIEEETFFLATGAPRWTNAMYYKGQIVIPLSESIQDSENIDRSIRHEYTHAVIHTLTNGNCPGWLDEGLAQWAEGNVNPALYKALAKWLESNPPLPHSLLQGGFTRLNPKMVPAAYAQSLVSTSALISQYGFVRIRKLFDEFKKGSDQSIAFKRAFGATHYRIEKDLTCALSQKVCVGNPGHAACMRCLSSGFTEQS